MAFESVADRVMFDILCDPTLTDLTGTTTTSGSCSCCDTGSTFTTGAPCRAVLVLDVSVPTVKRDPVSTDVLFRRLDFEAVDLDLAMREPISSFVFPILISLAGRESTF